MEKIENVLLRRLNDKYYEKSSEQDPMVMYLIVREELNMSIGKLCAQIGHAVQFGMETWWSLENIVNDDYQDYTEEQLILWERYQEWGRTSYTKVSLRADDKEWAKLKLQLKDYKIVIDNGKTELSPNTETVMVVFPMLKSERPKLLKRLQTL